MKTVFYPNFFDIINIFDTILSRRDIDVLVSPDGYQELIRLYARRISELLPEDASLSLLLGFSMGGMMAYDTACEWQELTGQEPVVVMGDSYLNLSSDTDDYTCPAATYEKWRDALREARGCADSREKIDFWDNLRLAIRGNKKAVPNYSGRVLLLRALRGQHKISDDIAIWLKEGLWYDIAKWIYRHLYLKSLFTRKTTNNIFLTAGYRHQTRMNISAWKQYKPDLKIVDLDASHLEMFRDRNMMTPCFRLLEQEIKKST